MISDERLAELNAAIPPDRRVRPLVLAHGCFDLLHLGHIRHLQEAKRLGAYLAVSVTADKYVAKGNGRPYFTAEQRAEALEALDCVDHVYINNAPTAIPMIEELRPDVYVKGVDYLDADTDDALEREKAALEKIGGKIVFTSAQKWSSSRLINGEIYAPDVLAYVTEIRDAGFLPRIEKAFAEIQTMKVALIGETIIDEYVYVSPLSKPSKEFILCGSTQRVEKFAGGIIAAAAHLENLCNVGIITHKYRKVTKRRYVEQGFTRKLFEVYEPSRLTLTNDQEIIFRNSVKRAVEDADAVIVIDFGHGLISEETREVIYGSKFLAVNAQTNAGNQGFNPVTKYRRADYVCVDYPEACLAYQDTSATPEQLIDFLALKMGGHVVVTHGREGAHWSGGTVPAFASKPVDTMGAGDCFLAVTAPLMATGLGVEEAAFVGAVAAGMKTEIVGHRSAVNGEVLLQTVRSLLA